MKLRDKIITGCLIFLLILLHRYLFQANEGFFASNPDYATLQLRLTRELGNYCKVATFVRDQLKTMVSATGGAADDASLDETYKSVYSCTDSLASSRPSCSLGMKGNTSMTYVSCDTYKLPTWSDNPSVAIALTMIRDDLPERLTREAEWFSAIINKLEGALAVGANPPTIPPTREQLDKIKAEGFSGTCSPDAAKLKIPQKLKDEVDSCTLADPVIEIARINTMLNSSQFKIAVSKMNGLLEKMLKLQSDLEKAKNGTLYSWQQGDPPKNYIPPFQGGDRIQSLVYSMRQNQ